MDMFTTTSIIPEQGETLIGEAFQRLPGGKGANQAVAAARLGAQVNMVGVVGTDRMGTELLEGLEKEGVSTAMVETTSETTTGTATILLSEYDNRIIVVPGANQCLNSNHLDRFKAAILRSDMVLLQFEIPIETVLYCIELCHEHNIPIIVNPAPALELPDETWLKATYITPNETEAEKLFKESEYVDELKYKIITTLGENGVYYTKEEDTFHMPAYPVETVDTTGAGDTFNGALAVALAEKQQIEEAIQFANAAAALATLKVGAQNGMPTRDDVEQLVEAHT